MPKQKPKYQPKPTPPVQQEIKKTARWKPYLALTVLTFILYSNTLNHFFVLDDSVVLNENKFTQQGIKGIPDIFKYDTFVGYFLNLYPEKTADQTQADMKNVAGGRYRPLSLATFALEIEFFGKANKYPNFNYEFTGNAFVSHLNNILLYLFTTCLLFLILYRLFPPKKDKKWYLSFPFIVTILFLAHPIHTEAVANIKGRDEIMTLLGSLAALWFTIKYFDTNKIYNLLLSGLCLFLGLLSKENAITFLAVIPITIYYFIDRKIGKILKAMLPLIIASAIFLFIRGSVIGFMSSSAIDSELLNNPFLNATKGETMATIFYTLIMYVKLLFFPHPLTFDYYPHHIEIVNWSNPVAILSLLFYLGITAYAIYELFKKFKSSTIQLNNSTIISYSIWFYLLPLTVVSNLFFPIGAFMGERFIFISSIGFCIFVGWLITRESAKGNVSRLRAVVLIIILCLFSVKTISRNNAWKDNFTLFQTDVKTSKNSAKINLGLGHCLSKKAVNPTDEDERQRRSELCEEAAQYLKRAIEIYPEYTDAIEQLGSLYFNCYKDIAKALHYYAVALRNTIKKSDAIYNNAKVILNSTNSLLSENKTSSSPNEIIRSCDELLSVRPDFGEAYYIKGLIYGKYLNNIELSLVNFEKAASLDFEKTARFYEDIGVIYGIVAKHEKSLQYLLKAVELEPDNHVTYTNIAVAYQLLGDMNNAGIYMAKGNEMKKKRENND